MLHLNVDIDGLRLRHMHCGYAIYDPRRDFTCPRVCACDAATQAKEKNRKPDPKECPTVRVRLSHVCICAKHASRNNKVIELTGIDTIAKFKRHKAGAKRPTCHCGHRRVSIRSLRCSEQAMRIGTHNVGAARLALVIRAPSGESHSACPGGPCCCNVFVKRKQTSV